MALPLFESTIPDAYAKTIHARDKFLMNNYKKFMEHCSVTNQPHHRKGKKKVEDDTAKQASFILKAGYYVFPLTANGRPDSSRPIHVYHTSVGAAYAQNPAFRKLCDDCGVTPHHMLQRMHEVDPDLMYVALDLKKQLTIEQMIERLNTAGWLLRNHISDSTYLKRIVWIDEVSVWFVPSKKFKIKVYCDKHDPSVRVHVVHNPFENSTNRKIKVRALCAVNYYLGAFYFETTTGTTNLVHYLNQRAVPYKVRRGTRLAVTTLIHLI